MFFQWKSYYFLESSINQGVNHFRDANGICIAVSASITIKPIKHLWTLKTSDSHIHRNIQCYPIFNVRNYYSWNGTHYAKWKFVRELLPLIFTALSQFVRGLCRKISVAKLERQFYFLLNLEFLSLLFSEVVRTDVTVFSSSSIHIKLNIKSTEIFQS